MTQGYNPPQAYGTTYSPTRGYSGERSNSSPNYWGEIQKMKEKYYDSLTSNLLIVFAV